MTKELPKEDEIGIMVLMTALEILDIYIQFFEKRGHKRIENAALVPQDDPSTLFTSSGMQSLVPYLLGEPHSKGKRLVNVQNCFRAADINEVGDNRHTTFFRMLGNWSLGDYFKKEEIPWFWEFLVNELKLDPKNLYVSVFSGYKQSLRSSELKNIPRDEESAEIWRELFIKENIDPEGRIFYCGVSDNWWSRSGTPDEMPVGEPGGPDTEVYFDFEPEKGNLKGSLDENIKSGRLLEIGNSVFMTYQKQKDGFKELPQKNVDFGGGLERLLAAVENQQDIFKTGLFYPIIKSIEKTSNKSYAEFSNEMRIITDHFVSASFIICERVEPSNKEQGSVLRRLIRRALDNVDQIEIKDASPIIESIVEQYKDTDPKLLGNFEKIKLTFLNEQQGYRRTLGQARKFIERETGVKVGDEIKGVTEISAETVFKSMSTYGLSPTQLRSLGFTFNDQELAEKIKEHQRVSKRGSRKKFVVR